MPWIEGESIATRERCQVCHKVSPVGFFVPHETWRRAVPRNWQNSVLCLTCFISFADERLLRWDEEIEFYPVSLRTHLEVVR